MVQQLKSRVGIIDDHRLFRKGIEEIIKDRKDIDLHISVGSSEELFQALLTDPIDLLLLDLRLNGEDGIDVLKRIKVDYPEMKVVALSMHDESAFIYNTVCSGAHGYLSKDVSSEKLIRTISNVLEQGSFYDPEVTEILVQKIKSSDLSDQKLNISEIETKLLMKIAEGKSAKEIGKELFKSTRTIEGYRQKLLEKSGSKNVAELVSWAYERKILKS